MGTLQMKCFTLLVAILLVLGLSSGAFAQAGTGELTGVITDPTGAVVPKIPVKLTNTSTGLSYASETTSGGVYRFSALPIVGTYKMEIEAPGFRKVLVSNLEMTVGTVITKDVKLEVGGTAEVVNVEAGAQMVETTESSVSQLVGQRIWQEMPLEVRNQNSFINLVAGVVPDAVAGSTRGAAVNGARGGTGNYMVEGMDNNDQGQGGRGQLSAYDPGGAVTSISPEAIQEYRVITNSFAAEYGKAGGFVTDTVLKSGTNQWHGSLFEYNRIQALAANRFFSNRSEDPYDPTKKLQDRLVRNQFGGSIGGPIVKDKSFFYFATEYHKSREAGTLSGVSTTQQFLDFVKSGQFATFMETSPNGLCNNQAMLDSITGGPGEADYKVAAPCPGVLSNSTTWGPIFTKLIGSQPFPLAKGDTNEGASLYTGPQCEDCTGILYPVPVYGSVIVSDPFRLNEYRYSGKFDQKLTNNDNLSAYYLHQHAESGDPYQGGGQTLGPAYINEGVSINTGVTWTHTFSPTILNSFKASYLRHRSDFPAPEGTLGIPQIVTYYDPMEVGFGLYSGLPQYFTDNQFQFQDHISFVHGKHSFKTGAEYRRTRNGSRFFNDTFGSFYPNGVEDLVTDMYFTDEFEKWLYGEIRNGSVPLASAAVDATTNGLPDVYRGFRANEMAAYFQDDWRISNRVTLNWGLRYEYFGPPHNFKPNIDSNFYFGTPITPFATDSTNPYMPKYSGFYARVATGTFQIRNNEIWNKDTNNFAPRFGLSWDVLGNQKFVMRMGAGIMYDRIYNNVFENIRFNPPYFGDYQLGIDGDGTPVGAIAIPGLYSVPFTGTYTFATGFTPAPNPRHMDQNIVSPYYEQIHFGFQWEFAKGYVFEPEYIGTFGHKLIGFRDINTFNGRRVAGLDGTRPNPNVGADNYRANDYASNYHGLQLTVRKSYSNGLQFNSSFTWSKALDTISDMFNSRGTPLSGRPTDNMLVKTDYGPADFDLRKRFVTSLSYDLPFAKENRFLGGWGLNTIISLQDGVPFSPYNSSVDLNRDGYLYDRVVPSTAPSDTIKVNKNIGTGDNRVTYLDGSMWGTFTCPATVNNGDWCNPPIGRNSVIGPGYATVDFNVTKKFKITERVAMTFQGNFFNLFNRPNFQSPTQNKNSAAFGKITDTFDPRVTQLALRLDF